MKYDSINIKEDSIYQLFIKIAIPSSIGTIFQNLYSLVDSIFAGQLISELALAAIGQIFPIYFVIIALSVGLSIGSTALIANKLGSNENNKASNIFLQSIILSIITSILVTIFGIILSEKIILSINTNLETLTLSLKYIKIIFFGSIFIFILLILNSYLSACGDTKSYRNVLIFSFILNIILNPILITGSILNFKLFSPLGIEGLAYATIISQLVGIFYLMYKIKKLGKISKIQIKYLVPNYKIIFNILRQGIPASIGMMMIAVGSYIILFFVAKFGDNAIAGYSAASRYELLFLLPLLGLNTAVLTIVGQNFGAKNNKRIIETYKKALLIGTIMLTCLGIIIFFTSEYAIKIFTDNEEAIKYGSIYLKICAFEFPIFPIFFITNATFQGLKKAIIVMYMAIIRFVIVPLILLSFVLYYLDKNYLYMFLALLFMRWLIAIMYFLFSKYKFKSILSKNY